MRAARVAAILLGLIGLVVIVPVVHRSPEATLGGSDDRLLALEVAAALALLAVAALSPSGPSAVLVAAVGAVWVVPEIAGGVGVPLVARTVSDAVAPLAVAALMAGVVLTSARHGSPAKPELRLAIAGAVVAASARLLLVDPFEQLGCWQACEHNPLLLGDGAFGPTVQWVGFLILVMGVAWAAAGRAVRGRAMAASHLAGWLVVLGLLLQVAWPGRPGTGLGLALAMFVNVTAVLWLTVLCRESWLRWRLESRLARWVTVLSDRNKGETLTDILRAEVRDPALRVAYWAPARNAYVDTKGRITSGAEPAPDERVTTVTRRGQTVSRIVHGRRVDGARLERALGPALRLALENEQLRAAALAELDELTLSRARVVERAALERRRLERNLHDGAQQRAVSLALLTRLLPADSPVGRDRKVRAEALTRALTEELRRVARGIYPAVLTDAGLLGAVIDLSEGSTDLPVVVAEFPEGRLPGTTESTAYLVVRAALTDARTRHASRATVSGRHQDGALWIRVEDDAEAAPARIATELADQVSALGGELAAIDEPGCQGLEVVLPCAS